jgi:hypothetical protein
VGAHRAVGTHPAGTTVSALIDELLCATLRDSVDPPARGWLDAAVGVACDVRDNQRRVTRELDKLDEHQLRALAVTLAALVPTDRPLTSLLSWLRDAPRRNQHTTRIPRTRHWTVSQLRRAHSRYNSALARARKAGVELVCDDLTREGEREYNRRRKYAQGIAS